jgi:hypothetical protein
MELQTAVSVALVRLSVVEPLIDFLLIVRVVEHGLSETLRIVQVRECRHGDWSHHPVGIETRLVTQPLLQLRVRLSHVFVDDVSAIHALLIGEIDGEPVLGLVIAGNRVEGIPLKSVRARAPNASDLADSALKVGALA